MTYEGSAHNTEESNRKVSAMHAEIAARREKIRKDRVRTNIEDAATVLLLMVLAFIAGVRVQAVYLTHEAEAPEWHCSAEDETFVQIHDPAYELDGDWACVHVDALEIAP